MVYRPPVLLGSVELMSPSWLDGLADFPGAVYLDPVEPTHSTGNQSLGWLSQKNSQ